MLGARYGRKILMCALVLVAVGVITVSGVSTSGSAEISSGVFGMPGQDGPRETHAPEEILVEAMAIENVFEHALDNVHSGMDEKDAMLEVSRAFKPSGNFSGTYEVVICQVGVREQEGRTVVDLKVMYELRDNDVVLRRELTRSGALAKGGD